VARSMKPAKRTEKKRSTLKRGGMGDRRKKSISTRRIEACEKSSSLQKNSHVDLGTHGGGELELRGDGGEEKDRTQRRLNLDAERTLGGRPLSRRPQNSRGGGGQKHKNAAIDAEIVAK